MQDQTRLARHGPARRLSLGRGSAGPDARFVVFLQPLQHDAAVLGQRPVLFLVQDEGDGVDAVASRGWNARRLGQQRPCANPEAARQAAPTFTAVRPATGAAVSRIR